MCHVLRVNHTSNTFHAKLRPKWIKKGLGLKLLDIFDKSGHFYSNNESIIQFLTN